jgi:hypothetical protein
VDAVAGALQSGEYNSYSTCVGLEPARRWGDWLLGLLSLFFLDANRTARC